MPSAIVAEAVTKRWGSTLALDGVTFEIGEGVTGLLGANGAGKTTFLGLVLGMHAPDAGHLQVLGLDPVSQGPEVRGWVGYAPEHDALPEDVSAHDIVRHLAELHGLPALDAQTRASDVLFEVGLGEERFRPVGTFSTGQRQRVKLAAAIAHDPRLVLLDEPTNGLDPVQREHMLALIRRVGHGLGIDVVLSSHLLEEVERVSDAVVILDQGHLSRAGTLAELRTADSEELLVEIDAPADDLVAALLTKGVAAKADGRVLIVELTGDDVYDVVRDTVADLGLGLRKLRRRRASLQDLYLAGTTR